VTAGEVVDVLIPPTIPAPVTATTATAIAAAVFKVTKSFYSIAAKSAAIFQDLEGGIVISIPPTNENAYVHPSGSNTGQIVLVWQ
jgi:hypothetical protein